MDGETAPEAARNGVPSDGDSPAAGSDAAAAGAGARGNGSGPARAARSLLAELVGALPGGGEARPGQAEMAGIVADALAGGTKVAVRAGTGTGKSLAVLAAVASTRHRTVIATATKALQDQYVDKELPFVASHRHLDWSVLKGRSNYACLARLEDARSVLAGEPVTGAQESLFGEDAADAAARPDPFDLGRDEDRLDAVFEWVATTATGDLSELPFELDRRTAAWVATGPDGCPGAERCPHSAGCFSEQAMERARESEVVLVNTALLGADLALGGAVLGEADAYVVDEAHEAEDILATAFGAELRSDDLIRLERNMRVGVPRSDELRSTVRRAAADLDTVLGAHRDESWRDGFPTSGDVATSVARAAGVVADAVAASHAAVRANPDDARAEAARRSADRLAEALARLTDDGEADALWVSPEGPTLRRVPIDIGARLSTDAWGDKGLVVTSATVSEPMVGRLGLLDADEPAPPEAFTDVGSPFDHRAAALLYVPALLSSVPPRDRNPNDPGWFDEACQEALGIIGAAGGRTLLLCTSMRNAEAFAAELRDHGSWPVLVQGELPKPKLLAEFARDEATVLVGTMGLWQGVDVPGPSLSCVIVDKLPFPRPDDPLWQARADHAARRLVGSGTAEADAGYRAFLEVQVPRAASLLAQGAGRLIRTADDRGVVAVLDPRLAEKSYRSRILGELPPMRRTRTFSDVEAHLRSHLG